MIQRRQCSNSRIRESTCSEIDAGLSCSFTSAMTCPSDRSVFMAWVKNCTESKSLYRSTIKPGRKSPSLKTIR